jgi:hypothetical protein
MDSPTILSTHEAKTRFADAAKGIAPSNVKPPSVQERLAPFSSTLLRYHQKGYSDEQLVEILKKPEIGIEVSVAVLRKFMTTARRKPAAQKAGATKSDVARAAGSSAPATPTAPSART